MLASGSRTHGIDERLKLKNKSRQFITRIVITKYQQDLKGYNPQLSSLGHARDTSNLLR